jgi:hypothetical protein
MYIVLLPDEIFYWHQLGPFGLWYHVGLGFLCWFFCLDNISNGDKGVLKSPITTVLESICAFKSFSVCLIKLGTLTLGTYRLIVVISFWCIAPFISMTWSSLFCLPKFEVYFVWYEYHKFLLFWGAIGLVNLLPAFHPVKAFNSVNKMGFW